MGLALPVYVMWNIESLLGALFLDERLEAIELAGMALILLGLLVIDGRLFSRR